MPIQQSRARRQACARAACAVAVIVTAGATACGSDAGGTPGAGNADGAPPLPGESGAPGSAIGASGLENGGLGTDWHPDPDGDGIKTGADRCPFVYDPAQADSNGDGIGDMCDPEVDKPVRGGAIDDLRAEHVTPYGAWLTFRSNATDQYGFRADVAWSTNRGDVESAAAFAATVKRGDTATMRVHERLGDRIPVPIVVTSLLPATKYFVAVRDGGDGDGNERVGKVLEITTLPAPALAPAATMPRVYATRAVLDELARKNRTNDKAWGVWKEQLAPRLARAVGDNELEEEKFCIAGALLHHGAGDAAALANAKKLHAALLARWETSAFRGNEYRWSDAALGICTDLLWNELDAATRERAITAILRVDEPKTLPANTDFRIDDTDERDSSVRTWIIDGLLGCKTPGLSAALSDRSCKVLEHGLRYLYGVMLVSARRDRGFLAMSGAHMVDSASYAPGSAAYWTQTLWALTNAGIPAAEYAPWVAHSLAATYLHATTPRLRGAVTYGDVDRYADNLANEASSVAIDVFHMNLTAMQMGLLKAARRDKEASWARYYLNTLSKPDNYQNRSEMLLFDSDAIPPVDYRTVIPPTYFDSGFGILYDRTSWSENASMLMFRAGWSGVDHSQEEQGHFQVYRKGRWLTHESVAYDGEATQIDGHNVVQLEALYNNDIRRPGQFAFRNNGPARIVRTSASARHGYAHADLTPMHQSGLTAYYVFDAVQRAILWIKGDEAATPDAWVVYDTVDANQSGLSRVFQLHVDAAPSIDGRHAAVTLGDQRLDVSVLLPTTATLTTTPPDGAPGNPSDAIYTYRLRADAGAAPNALRFLTVLQGSDAAVTAPAVRAIEADAWVGAAVGTVVSLFPRAPIAWASGAAQAATANVDIGNATRVYWAGHKPATTYAVTVATGKLTAAPVASGAGIAADRGGVLTFDIDAGGRAAVSPRP